MITIFHVQIKTKFYYRAHHYFGSISAIYEDEKIKKLIKVSIHTLYKHDFDSKFENDVCYIFKSELKTKSKKKTKKEPTFCIESVKSFPEVFEVINQAS